MKLRSTSRPASEVVGVVGGVEASTASGSAGAAAGRRLDAGGRAPLAEQADVAGADGRLEVGDQPVVVADLAATSPAL